MRKINLTMNEENKYQIIKEVADGKMKKQPLKFV